MTHHDSKLSHKVICYHLEFTQHQNQIKPDRNARHITICHHFLQGKKITDRVLRSIAENFEDLRHFPPGSQVHSETGHGAPCSQADYTTAREGERKDHTDVGAKSFFRTWHS